MTVFDRLHDRNVDFVKDAPLVLPPAVLGVIGGAAGGLLGGESWRAILAGAVLGGLFIMLLSRLSRREE